MPLSVNCILNGPFAENMYVAVDVATKKGVVIDPGIGAVETWRRYESQGATLEAILLTHAHLDHIFGLRELKDATSVDIWCHPDDEWLIEKYPEICEMYGLPVETQPLPDKNWVHGDTFELGETTFEIRHTPGHSPGSVSLCWPGGCFTGDALFAGSIGRTDFPRSDFATLEKAVREQLYTLPDETVIYPGHMDTSTIGHERATNPFVRPVA